MNRSKLLAIATIAATVFFTSHKASAVMGVVNISGTITFEVDTTTDNTAETMKTVKKSFKNADALALLANATGQSWFTASGSKLVYDPDAFDGTVFGVFWVTNTITHQGLQLSQTSDSGYLSYVELDFTPWELGFTTGAFNENGVFSGKYIATPYSYSDKIMGNAILYIHDNAGDYDYVDAPSVAADNNFAVVITGPIAYSYNYTPSTIPGFFKSKNSFSLKGSGDAFWNDSSLIDLGYLPQAVFTGSAKYSGSGLEEFDDSPLTPF